MPKDFIFIITYMLVISIVFIASLSASIYITLHGAEWWWCALAWFLTFLCGYSWGTAIDRIIVNVRGRL